jgi:hypothetical protein
MSYAIITTMDKCKGSFQHTQMCKIKIETRNGKGKGKAKTIKRDLKNIAAKLKRQRSKSFEMIIF